MLTVLGIVALLTAFGLPALQQLVASQRVGNAASQLQSSLLLTRSEALKRNADVQLSPTVGQDWTSGWRVLLASDGTVLSTTEAQVNLVITGPASVLYRSSGRGEAASGVKLSSAGSSAIRCITIGLTGIPVVASTGC